MKHLFVDTSAWCAIEDRGDDHHEIALLFKDEIAGSCVLVTTDYVMDEIYTWPISTWAIWTTSSRMS